MQKITQGLVPYYIFQNLQPFTEIVHFVSSREGGVSQDEYNTLNISLKGNDDKAHILHNRQKLADTLQIPLEYFCFAQQTHEDVVAVIDKKDKGRGVYSQEDAMPQTDAMITQESDICLVVMSADCVPILLYDQKQKVIGAVHSGWRGTVKKILSLTVQKMIDVYHSNPKDILVGIAPCIGAEAYQVGEEVVQAVQEAFGTIEGYTQTHPQTGKKHLDLIYANQRQLLNLGIPTENMETSGFCTYQNADVFYSYRKSQGKTGIFASGIMLVG
jgi:polyphenol oxidase